MNGRLTVELTATENNPTLAGIVHAPFLDTKGRLETLFLAVLGRLPREDERETLVGYVEEMPGGSPRERAYGDLFWVLVNTTEFNTNH